MNLATLIRMQKRERLVELLGRTGYPVVHTCLKRANTVTVHVARAELPEFMARMASLPYCGSFNLLDLAIAYRAMAIDDRAVTFDLARCDFTVAT